MKIKEFRQKKGWSQAQLGRKLGVPQRTVSSWETGFRELPVRQAKKIGLALDCDWRELYED